jgi:hypothetical protein
LLQGLDRLFGHSFGLYFHFPNGGGLSLVIRFYRVMVKDTRQSLAGHDIFQRCLIVILFVGQIGHDVDHPNSFGSFARFGDTIATGAKTASVWRETKQVSQIVLGKQATLSGVLQNLVGKCSLEDLALVNLLLNRSTCD